MKYYIVVSGLTRRLIEAENLEDAEIEFMKHRPMGRYMLNGAKADEIFEVRLATESEIDEFTGRRKPPVFDDQVAFELDDARKQDIRQGYA